MIGEQWKAEIIEEKRSSNAGAVPSAPPLCRERFVGDATFDGCADREQDEHLRHRDKSVDAETSEWNTAIAIQFKLIVSDNWPPRQSLTSPLKIVNTRAMSRTATKDENRPAPYRISGSPNIPTSHRATKTPSPCGPNSSQNHP